MEKLKEIAKVLEQIGFPARPTKNQLLLYKEVICKTVALHKSPNVLVLGATPELRDLCIEHNCKTTAISPGKMALQTMTYMMKYKNHPDNISIENNWSNMLISDKIHDLVLTDMALTGNPCEKHEPIIKEVHRVLKPGGFFFLRSFDMLEHDTKPELEDLLTKWRKKEITAGDFLYLSVKVSLDENHNISQAKNFELFKKYYFEGKFTTEEVKHIKPYASEGTMSCPHRKDMIKLFSTFFEDVSIRFAKDPVIKSVEQDALYFMRKPKT